MVSPVQGNNPDDLDEIQNVRSTDCGPDLLGPRRRDINSGIEVSRRIPQLTLCNQFPPISASLDVRFG